MDDDGPLITNLGMPPLFSTNPEQQSEILWHIYLVLKPNEEKLNSKTKEMLAMIEKHMPDTSEANMYGEHLSERVCMAKYGFKDGKLHRLGTPCKEEASTSIKDVINDTYPTPVFDMDRITTHDSGDDSSGIEGDIGDGLPASPSQRSSSFPLPLKLTAPLKISTSTRAAEVLQRCRLNKQQRAKRSINAIFESTSSGGPLLPTVPLPSEDKCLKPKVALIYVKTRSDAMSPALREKCLQEPICLMRDLTHAVGLDLSKFTTKNIERIAHDFVIELRQQPTTFEEPRMINAHTKDWHYNSLEKRTRVDIYSNYQADTFAKAIKDAHMILKEKNQSEAIKSEVVKLEPIKFDSMLPERSPSQTPSQTPSVASTPRLTKKRRRSTLNSKAQIYFGTNVDFSEEMFSAQVVELQKLPPFCRLADETNNFLSHLGFDLKGMNTAQFYMKIPGCRTPAHLENNSFCSVNLNIGPGDCEWFGVSYEYYPLMEKMCKERRLDFLNGSYWPDYDELIRAGIPVYRFLQKTGDIVWINGGCVHWVEAKGWTNNIAWNVGPTSIEQYKLNLLSTEFNRNRKFESLVPMQYLSWQIAKNCPVVDEDLRQMIRGVLIRSLAHTQMIADYVKQELKMQIEFVGNGLGRLTTNCVKCKGEIFNILFARQTNPGLPAKKAPKTYGTFCLYCAKSMGFASTEVWQLFRIEELCAWLDNFTAAS